MSTPLLSPHWYRVGGLRPRLRSGVQVVRQRIRGERWAVLTDPVSGRHLRFDSRAWAWIAACDGSRSLDDIWHERADDRDALTQDEALALVAHAFQAQLLLADVSPEADAVLRALARQRRRRRRQTVNPLAFRVPLVNPDAFLKRHLHWVTWLPGAGVAALLGVLAVAAMGVLVAEGAALAAHLKALLQSSRFWLLSWLLYPAMKVVHELAHAFAVRRHGGAVPAMGITLLMLTPVPYVDASASTAFSGKWQRAGVAAAGIAAELTLAALALVAWWALEPGLARDAALTVVAVGGVSTLLVNGNPLLRFDGYHVATDLLELPNLAVRSRQWWLLLVRRGLGAHGVRPLRTARGETPWLVAYAPLSWAMQGLLLAVAVGVMASWSTWLAAMLLLLAAWLLLARPAWKALRWLMTAGELQGGRARAGVVMAGIAAVAGLAVTALPLPHRVHAPGIVWLPDDALVRLDADGFIARIAAVDGQRVEPGMLIATLVNDATLTRHAALQAEWQQLRIEQASRFDNDAAGSARAADRARYLAHELERSAARVAALEVRAPRAGRLVLDPLRIGPGLYMRQGELLGHILPDGPPLVRAFVHNDHLGLVAGAPGDGARPAAAGRVHFAQGGAPVAAARTAAAVQASRELPSLALSEAFGGSIALDPSEAPPGAPMRLAAEPRLRVDLQLPEGVRAPVGARVLVEFDSGPITPARWMAAQLRRLFLRHVTA